MFLLKLAQLAERRMLKLADALAAVTHQLPNLRHAVRVAIFQSKTKLDDTRFTRG